jgi:hypothetical protein
MISFAVWLLTLLLTLDNKSPNLLNFTTESVSNSGGTNQTIIWLIDKFSLFEINRYNTTHILREGGREGGREGNCHSNAAGRRQKLNNENTSAHCTRTSRTSKELGEKRASGNSNFSVFIGGVYGGKSFSSSLQLNWHTWYDCFIFLQIEVTILLRVQRV